MNIQNKKDIPDFSRVIVALAGGVTSLNLAVTFWLIALFIFLLGLNSSRKRGG